MKRTHTCGELTIKKENEKVVLCGWVNSTRDHGGVIFIDLRDRAGITQVVFNPDENGELHSRAETLRSECVITVEGVVRKRPEGTVNPSIYTGEIELRSTALEVLSVSATPPFEIGTKNEISEELRLTYRYLDLRRPFMQENIAFRHRTVKLVRDFFDEKGFLEIETSVLTKSTPEGARDYLVPSRVNPSKFYALPQSPQLFKQVLMVSGFDKYFQVARCFRDEDLRADRQPEFTQLDIEMSFIDEEDIYSLTEQFVALIMKKMLNRDVQIPFPRFTYKEAMSLYGTDKPDLRFGAKLTDLSGIFSGTKFGIFKNALEKGGIIKGIRAAGCAGYSLSQIKELTDFVNNFGAQGLVPFKVEESNVSSPVAKFMNKSELDSVVKTTEAEPGDLILCIAGEPRVVHEALGALRLEIARREKWIESRADEYRYLWITDFPLFKYNEEDKRWESEHHPFTAPRESDIELLSRDPGAVISRSYDLVFNGVEIGSGSIRIHRLELQKKIFDLIGINPEVARDRFGFLLEALKYGAPPHGGIAFGLDRMISIYRGTESIRDVIAFPKTQKAFCLLTGAPSTVPPEQLKELGIAVKK